MEGARGAVVHHHHHKRAICASGCGLGAAPRARAVPARVGGGAAALAGGLLPAMLRPAPVPEVCGLPHMVIALEVPDSTALERPRAVDEPRPLRAVVYRVLPAADGHALEEALVGGRGRHRGRRCRIAGARASLERRALWSSRRWHRRSRERGETRWDLSLRFVGVSWRVRLAGGRLLLQGQLPAGGLGARPDRQLPKRAFPIVGCATLLRRDASAELLQRSQRHRLHASGRGPPARVARARRPSLPRRLNTRPAADPAPRRCAPQPPERA